MAERQISEAMKLASSLPWAPEIDGVDLVIRNVTGTCFGGDHDTGDNGQTESGIPTAGNPGLLGCALPIRSTERATACSPLAFKGPHIPWKTRVKVWREAEGEETAIELELVDNGPDVSRYPTHAIDLTPAAALHFAPGFDLRKIANSWSSAGMSYRIIGGARFAS